MSAILDRAYRGFHIWARHYSAALLYFLLSLSALIIMWWVGWGEVNALGSQNPLVRFFRLLGDAVMMLLPFWFLGRKFRPATLILIWAVAIWSMISLTYTRFWDRPLEIYSILLTSNLDLSLLKAGWSLLQPRDILYPAIALGLTAYTIIRRKSLSSSPSFSRKARLTATGFTLLLFLFSQALAIRSSMRGARDAKISFSISSDLATRYLCLSDAYADIMNNGVVVHLLKSIRNFHLIYTLPKTLDDKERGMIETFMTNTPPSSTSATFSHNSRKNLILIVVESLNAEVIGMRIEGREVTPTLNRLLSSPGTIAALNVATQVREGMSGDGQLIINTGLHPLPRYSTFMTCGDNVQFPSIVRSLPTHRSVAFFGDDSRVWNERASFQSLGFPTIFDNRSYPPASHGGGDAAVFGFAANYLKSLPTPFFAEILTVSMHLPFDDHSIPTRLLPTWMDRATSHQWDTNINPGIDSHANSATPLSEQTRRYLKMTNYFDTCLATFIDSLKRSGLYDDSVIVIASDHSQDFASDSKGDIPMLFMALNTGTTQRISRRVGHIDIYPTILQIMGAYDSARWKGVGISILDERLNAAYSPLTGFSGTPHPAFKERMMEAYPVSELIIRANYFSSSPH